jgi:predicted regulator of amino acid metabolism with ACT domain
MYPILEDAFLRYPMRRKVAEILLKYGLRVDKNSGIFCADIGISPVKIARAVGVDRRVVLETAQMIAGVPELSGIFESLAPKAFISGVAKNLGFEVIEIEAEPHAVGIVSKISAIIADARISIRQIVSDDPDIYPNPKLTIVLEKRLPGQALVKIRALKDIKRISIG